MIIKKAAKLYLTYLENNTRPNTVRSFRFVLHKFAAFFPDREMGDIKESDIIEFIGDVADHCSLSTKNSRVGVLRAFYNFIIETSNAEFPNPCLRPMIKKLFKPPRSSSPKLLEKDLIDEIIFRTINERNRLILELMGRSGMRIGEVLNILAADIDADKATILIREPKSGRSGEKVYITKKLCSRLQSYISKKSIKDTEKLFSLSYSTAYRMVKRSAQVVNASLRPHDLRRHAVTQASRSGIPLEIVSKVICRHANISTTQIYLGSIDHDEASRWIEHLNR